MAINYWNPHTFNLPKRLSSVGIQDIPQGLHRDLFKEQTKPWADEIIARRISPNMERNSTVNIGYLGFEIAEKAWAVCLKYLHDREIEAYAMFNSTIEEDIQDNAFRAQCYRSPVLGVFGIGSLRSLSFQAQAFIKSVLETRFYALKPMVFQSQSMEAVKHILGANSQDPNKFFPRLFGEDETCWIELPEMDQ